MRASQCLRGRGGRSRKVEGITNRANFLSRPVDVPTAGAAGALPGGKFLPEVAVLGARGEVATGAS